MPGTVAVKYDKIMLRGQIERKVLTLDWVADSSAHTIPDTDLTDEVYKIGGWYLYSAKTIPGAGVAPTDQYDIAVNDADGFDIAGGMLANRDDTDTELVNIGTAASGFPVVESDLTVTIGNNSVNSATGTLILTFVPA